MKIKLLAYPFNKYVGANANGLTSAPDAWTIQKGNRSDSEELLLTVGEKTVDIPFSKSRLSIVTNTIIPAAYNVADVPLYTSQNKNTHCGGSSISISPDSGIQYSYGQVVDGPAACADYCTGYDTACTGFVYTPATKKCYVKSSTSSSTVRKNLVDPATAGRICYLKN